MGEHELCRFTVVSCDTAVLLTVAGVTEESTVHHKAVVVKARDVVLVSNTHETNELLELVHTVPCVLLERRSGCCHPYTVLIQESLSVDLLGGEAAFRNIKRGVDTCLLCKHTHSVVQRP